MIKYTVYKCIDNRNKYNVMYCLPTRRIKGLLYRIIQKERAFEEIPIFTGLHRR